MPFGPIGHMRAGKGSRIQVNGINLVGPNAWECSDRGDDLDTTTFESAGAEQGLIGVEVAEWNFKGDWNAALNNYDNPPAIYPQDLFPNLFFFTNAADVVFWNLPFSRVLATQNGAEARGKVTFNANGKSNGGYIRPTGSR